MPSHLFVGYFEVMGGEFFFLLRWLEGASYIETAEENLYNYLSGLTRTGNGKWLLEQNVFYFCDFFVVFIVAKKGWL